MHMSLSWKGNRLPAGLGMDIHATAGKGDVGFLRQLDAGDLRQTTGKV